MGLRQNTTLFVAVAFLALLVSPCSAQSPTLGRRAVFGAAVADDPGGVRISAIVPGSPAANAGLKIGDVLTALGTMPVSTPPDFIKAVHEAPVSTPLPVTLIRGGKIAHVQLTLVPAPRELPDADVDVEYSAIPVDGSLRRTLITLPKRYPSPRPALLL